MRAWGRACVVEWSGVQEEGRGWVLVALIGREEGGEGCFT
jgi:hypothetical protein